MYDKTMLTYEKIIDLFFGPDEVGLTWDKIIAIILYISQYKLSMRSCKICNVCKTNILYSNPPNFNVVGQTSTDDVINRRRRNPG